MDAHVKVRQSNFCVGSRLIRAGFFRTHNNPLEYRILEYLGIAHCAREPTIVVVLPNLSHPGGIIAGTAFHASLA